MSGEVHFLRSSPREGGCVDKLDFLDTGCVDKLDFLDTGLGLSGRWSWFYASSNNSFMSSFHLVDHS